MKCPDKVCSRCAKRHRCPSRLRRTLSVRRHYIVVPVPATIPVPVPQFHHIRHPTANPPPLPLIEDAVISVQDPPRRVRERVSRNRVTLMDLLVDPESKGE